jgi:hypothetical protein
LGRLIDEGAFGRVYMGEAYGIMPGKYKNVVAIKTLKGILVDLKMSKVKYYNI